MKDNLNNKINEIVNDKVHGAAQIAQHVLEFFKLHAVQSEDMSNNDFLNEINFICGQFKNIDIDLAPVHNSIETFKRKLLHNLSSDEAPINKKAEAIAKALLEELQQSYIKIAQYFSILIHSESTIMTLSQSSTIRNVLIWNKKNIRHVFVMESRPLQEGREQASVLISNGISTSLIADAACGHFAKETDIIIIGADRVLRDGSVINKVGSYPLALVAKENVIPFYVACESIKWDPRYDPDKFIPQKKDEIEIIENKIENLNVRNIYFERVTPDLITKVVTEKTRVDEKYF